MDIEKAYYNGGNSRLEAGDKPGLSRVPDYPDGEPWYPAI
jgi:hypothetical protein